MESEEYKYYLRARFSLEIKLSEIGDFRGSPEVESQMHVVEERLNARIKQAYYHAKQELDGLRMVLIEATKIVSED